MQIKKTISDRLSTLHFLPSLPQIVLKLIKACNQEKTGAREIAAIIEKDPSLTSNILRLVNSAHYSMPRKVHNLEQALGLVGLNTAKNVAICASIHAVFLPIRSRVGFNLKVFWYHSLRCALLARFLAEKTGYAGTDEAFMSGLLHDIGKLVMVVNFVPKIAALPGEEGSDPDFLKVLEKDLEVTHAEVGAWIISRWKLQSFVVDSVLYHHEPILKIASAFPLVQIVYTANSISKKSSEPEDPAFAPAQYLFGLGAGDIQNLISRADAELTATAESFEIEIEPPEEVQRAQDHIKREELRHEVRDISLQIGTLQNLLSATDLEAIVREVEQGLRVLCGSEIIRFFLYDPDKIGLLEFSSPEDHKPDSLADVFIPMRLGASLLVESLQEERCLHSFASSEHPVSTIVDAQILRYLGSDGMYCLPMIMNGSPIGVIVLGVNAPDVLHFPDNLKPLTMLVQHAAVAIYVQQMRRRQLKRIQSERIGASNAMARKVVHEVNNPLGIIKNYLKILGLKLDRQNIAQDEIRIINEEIDRIALLLERLTGFSEKEGYVPVDIDINALLSDIIKITKDSLLKDSGIRISSRLVPALPALRGDRNQLKEVFLNLISNAADALSGGGEITVRTRHLTVLSGLGPDKREGFIEVIIADNGPGIPEHIESRLFEPLVTSKGAGHSGLGLSIVYDIVKDLKGTISYESGKGGTAFHITLPARGGREA